MKRKQLLLSVMTALSFTAVANPVIVKMNAVSKTMSLVSESGTEIQLPQPANQEYSFNVDPGRYILSAYASDGTTLNGKIVINVTDSTTTQQFTVLTCTAYVTNKNESDGTSWNREKGDYTLDVRVNTREGKIVEQTIGQSTTKGRYTFLALNGNSYTASFVPSDAHREEGYMTLYRGGTLTANVNVSGSIPMGGDFEINVPDDAKLQVGLKFTHFTDFTPVEPVETISGPNGKTYKYRLANGQVYNYRTWKKGGLTHGGYFTMNTDENKRPVINFTEEDFAAHDPKAINHSPQSNNGYETGDLLLNINPAHHLKLKLGDEFLVHGMRMWELSDNSTNNYFFEPDLHYKVLDTNFKPSNEIIEIDNSDTNVSAWSTIKAKGTGTAIVMVTYDGINLNYYNNAEKKDYLGGEYWGAIWPENTGVFVVTVGGGDSSVAPNMTVNEEYNMDALRLAGNNVDAEHDVFYYLDTEEGFYFTFSPESVESLEIATPMVTETEMRFSGFSTDGVKKNEDGSYTLLLKEGKTIVRLTDAGGKCAYQVLRAKPCHREITNQTRPGSKIFQPGDQVKIQYSGLYHPANKIAGIYNMSAYVTYNGVPNGSSLILGSGQYTFGSAASAQAVFVDIPLDHNVTESPQLIMDKGVIQVNGYGDPIGNHRNTSPTAGRSPNFTAVPHKTYFGSIPDVRIDLNPIRYFNISLAGVPEDAEVTLKFNGTDMEPNGEGLYTGTYGTYSIIVYADGYKCFRHDYTIEDESEKNVVFPVEMQLLGNAWDGKSKIQPQISEEGVYLISNGAELAWFADRVNTEGISENAELTSDIELGNFNWIPIGNSSKKYSGVFNGAGHSVSEIYIDATSTYQGLFGYLSDAEISGVIVNGTVKSSKQYVGGLAGYVVGNSMIDRCANYCDVHGTTTYVGGLIGYLNSANAKLTNCYNAGNVSGTTNCGGVIGNSNAAAIMSNIFNVGIIEGTGVGACVGGSTVKNNLTNAFSIKDYQITTGQTAVTPEMMASGEIAYKLGEAFTQAIGTDPYPVFDSAKVYYDEDENCYYNIAASFEINCGEGLDDAEVEGNEITMQVKAEYGLDIIATPIGARLPEIVWSSSDDELVKVDASGVLSAVNVGKVEIKATGIIAGEEIVSICNVTVVPAVVKSINLEATEISLDLADEEPTEIMAHYEPSYAEKPEVNWFTSDESILTVIPRGDLCAVLKPVACGVAEVKVEYTDKPEIFDTCKVYVTHATSISDILEEGAYSKVDVYDFAGRLIRLGADMTELSELSPGLYIIRTKSKEYKVFVK